MLQAGGQVTKQILLDLFNEVLKPTATPPQQWKHTILTVIYKTGNPQVPSNYRPISAIPLLYKLFARMLYTRLTPILDPQQSQDQAGFRKHFSTLDHLFTLTCLEEKGHEFNQKIWLAALDFKKAFDTVEHKSLWEALNAQGVSNGYVNLLAQLYAGQTGQVRTDTLSKAFNIQRGTKQGDPLSSLLFNSLLEHVMRPLKHK
eukprot:9084690-Karenia_brevis.AAC.1